MGYLVSFLTSIGSISVKKAARQFLQFRFVNDHSEGNWGYITFAPCGFKGKTFNTGFSSREEIFWNVKLNWCRNLQMCYCWSVCLLICSCAETVNWHGAPSWSSFFHAVFGRIVCQIISWCPPDATPSWKSWICHWLFRNYKCFCNGLIFLMSKLIAVLKPTTHFTQHVQ